MALAGEAGATQLSTLRPRDGIPSFLRSRQAEIRCAALQYRAVGCLGSNHWPHHSQRNSMIARRITRVRVVGRLAGPGPWAPTVTSAHSRRWARHRCHHWRRRPTWMCDTSRASRATPRDPPRGRRQHGRCDGMAGRSQAIDGPRASADSGRERLQLPAFVGGELETTRANPHAAQRAPSQELLGQFRGCGRMWSRGPKSRLLLRDLFGGF